MTDPSITFPNEAISFFVTRGDDILLSLAMSNSQQKLHVKNV